MKNTLTAITVTLLTMASCTTTRDNTADSAALPPLAGEELIARGKYLVTIAGCNDCHSPKVMTEHGPVPDTSRLLSGHPASEPLPPLVNHDNWMLFNMGLTAFVGPWGVSYAANLTPDDTGTRNWTVEQFKTAIRKGKYKGLEGSRPLLPPMPWEMYRHMTDQDLEAVFSYLKSLKPVHNLVPAPINPQSLMAANTDRKQNKEQNK